MNALVGSFNHEMAFSVSLQFSRRVLSSSNMTWHDMTWHDSCFSWTPRWCLAPCSTATWSWSSHRQTRVSSNFQKYKWKQPWMLSHCQPSNTFYFPIWYLLQYEYPIKRMVLSRKYFADGMTFYLKVLRAVSFLKENFRKFVILLLRCLLFLSKNSLSQIIT